MIEMMSYIERRKEQENHINYRHLKIDNDYFIMNCDEDDLATLEAAQEALILGNQEELDTLLLPPNISITKEYDNVIAYGDSKEIPLELKKRLIKGVKKDFTTQDVFKVRYGEIMKQYHTATFYPCYCGSYTEEEKLHTDLRWEHYNVESSFSCLLERLLNPKFIIIYRKLS